jgi:hypothetical protein
MCGRSTSSTDLARTHPTARELDGAGMAGTTRAERGQGPAHTERHLSPTTGEPIYVFCDCPIGQAHTYDERVTQFEGPPAHVSPPRRHRERHYSVRTGEWADIQCDCPIGSNHTAEAWVACFGREPMLELTGIPHMERHISSSTGATTYVDCECPIGSQHTYADWVARFGHTVFLRE